MRTRVRTGCGCQRFDNRGRQSGGPAFLNRRLNCDPLRTSVGVHVALVFSFVLKLAFEKKLLTGMTVGVDATTLEANAAMKSIVRRESGAWRKLDRATQEKIAGRMKISRCPIASVDADGSPVAVVGCPAVGTSHVLEPGNEAFRDAPLTGDATIQKSHVQRANRFHSTNFAAPQSLRFYRQGYEFLEPTDSGVFRLGLHFVAFVDTPTRVLRVLTRGGWLGRVNFGGSESGPSGSSSSPLLLSVRAAGVYVVPPASDEHPEQLPGREIFVT